MPGLAGIICRSWTPRTDASLSQLAGALTRESFDTAGTWAMPAAGVGATWVTHCGTFADCLPVWNETREIVLFFYGEDFRDSQELASLRQKGHQFTDDTAEYLVHLYEENPETFLVRLNGSFSGLIVDLRRRQTILFNDRYGLQRVYLHRTRDALFFSTEAKALLRVAPETRQIDLKGLGEWFSCGCVLQNRSLFKGIATLPPSSSWHVGLEGRVDEDVYFKPETWEAQPPLSAADYEEALHAVFPRVIKRYLNGRQRVGMSLTGGLDGRMIMAWAGATPKSLPCYTFNGPYHDCLDVQVARRLAAACGQSHHTIEVGADFLKDFSTFAEKTVQASAGAMDVSAAVEIYANRRAREIAPVRLTGNYGSEIIRGNVAFKPGRISSGLPVPELADAIDKAAAQFAIERQSHPLSFIAFKQVPWHHHARLSVEQSQLTMRSPYLDNELVALVYRAPAPLRTAADPSRRLIADGAFNLMRIPTDRGIVYPPKPVITPLRHQFEEFLIRLEYFFDYGMSPRFARVVGPLLPQSIERLPLGRQKFYHYRTWYRHELAPYLRAILLDDRTRSRNWYRPGFIEHMVESHIRGSGNYTREFHKVLTLELLERQLTDAA